MPLLWILLGGLGGYLYGSSSQSKTARLNIIEDINALPEPVRSQALLQLRTNFKLTDEDIAHLLKTRTKRLF